MLCKTMKSRQTFDIILSILKKLCVPKILFSDSIIFSKRKVGGFNPFKHPSYKHYQLLKLLQHHQQHHQHHQHLQHPQHRRSKSLHPHRYYRLWLFQIRTVAAGTEAESICLFRTSSSFRVQRNIVLFYYGAMSLGTSSIYFMLCNCLKIYSRFPLYSI